MIPKNELVWPSVRRSDHADNHNTASKKTKWPVLCFYYLYKTTLFKTVVSKKQNLTERKMEQLFIEFLLFM